MGSTNSIAAVFAVLWLPRLLVARPAAGATRPWQQAERFSVPVAYLVGTVAMFWVFDRSYSFLG